jgi:uncharacterized membrane protein HdeD (DUF308 family)
MLLHALARNWWLVLLRGILAVVFGLLAFAWPGLTLLVLVTLYGVYALADGAVALVAAMRGQQVGPRWWLVVVGLAGVAAGLATLLWPGLTALVLIVFIGGWAVAHGVMDIVGAIKLRKEIDHEWLLILGGCLSILFGLFVLARPGAGALALVWVIGAYSIVFGAVLMALAFRLKRHQPATP